MTWAEEGGRSPRKITASGSRTFAGETERGLRGKKRNNRIERKYNQSRRRTRRRRRKSRGEKGGGGSG